MLMPQEKAPPPDPAKLKTAEAQVHDVLKPEYAKPDRKALANDLFKVAADTNDDPAARYFLLREAIGLAGQAGDFGLGAVAIDELGKRFQVDVLPMKLTFLTDAAKAAATPEAAKGVAEASLYLLQQTLSAENYPAAEGAIAAAQAAAKKAKDIALYSRVELRAKEYAAAKASSESIKKQRDALARNADDPAANLAVGRHECLLKGNWAAGLPCLAKGGDAALKELAAKDLANPADAEGQVAVADGWWELGDKEGGEAKVRARKRAAEWYAKAVGGVGGLTKTKAEKRIADAKGEDRSPGLVALFSFEEGSGSTSTDVSGGNLVATLVGSASWGSGVQGNALKLDGSGAHAEVPNTPALNVELDSFTTCAFIRPENTNAMRVVNKWNLPGARGWMLDINSVPGGATDLAVRGGRLRTRIADGTGGLELAGDAKIQPAVWTHVALVLDRQLKEARLYADGVQVGPGQPFTTLGNLSSDAALGVGTIPPNTGGWFNGLIDDVRLYRRVLSPAELKELAARK